MLFASRKRVGPPEVVKLDHWRAARAVLAAAFVAAGTAKLVAPGGPAGVPDAVRVVLSAVEIGGGLLLLVPQLVSFAAAVLIAACGAVAAICLSDETAPPVWPALAVALTLGAVGYACRPGAVARARLERAIDPFMEFQHTGRSGGGRG